IFQRFQWSLGPRRSQRRRSQGWFCVREVHRTSDGVKPVIHPFARARARNMQKTRACLLASGMICASLAGRADNAPPKIAPEGPTWSAGAGFQFDAKADKKRESVSGITCPSVSASPRVCVVAFDEGGEARFVIIEHDRLIPQPEPIVLLPGERELDAEGAAR